MQRNHRCGDIRRRQNKNKNKKERKAARAGKVEVGLVCLLPLFDLAPVDPLMGRQVAVPSARKDGMTTVMTRKNNSRGPVEDLKEF